MHFLMGQDAESLEFTAALWEEQILKPVSVSGFLSWWLIASLCSMFTSFLSCESWISLCFLHFSFVRSHHCMDHCRVGPGRETWDSSRADTGGQSLNCMPKTLFLISWYITMPKQMRGRKGSRGNKGKRKERVEKEQNKCMRALWERERERNMS